MTGGIKYYFNFLSQPSRAMYIIMKLSKTPFEEHIVELRTGEHRTDEFKDNINRFQRVPCIVNGNFKLAESIAILRYLDGLGLISNKLYPKDLEQRARVDEYLEWQQHNTRLNGFMYFQHKLMRPLMHGKDVIPQRLAALESHFSRSMDNIENIWLKSSRYIASDENLTAADIFAACEIEQPIIAGFNPFENRPKLTVLMASIKEETNPHYEVAHNDCHELKHFYATSKL